jgi:hypothetical protein
MTWLFGEPCGSSVSAVIHKYKLYVEWPEFFNFLIFLFSSFCGKGFKLEHDQALDYASNRVVQRAALKLCTPFTNFTCYSLQTLISSNLDLRIM